MIVFFVSEYPLSDLRGEGSNSMSKSRFPARKSSKRVAIKAPAGHVLPPTVQSLRSVSRSHSRCTSASASSGFSIGISLPSRRRNSLFV